MAGVTCAGCTTTYAVGAAKCPQCGSTERTDRAGGTVLPSVTVACSNEVCRFEGRERRVHLRTAAPGVVEVPRLACAGCGFDMPTVTPWPPVAESEDEDMPKITVHGGASNEYAEPEQADEVEGGEESSPGSSSETSSESASTKPEQSDSETRSPARTTGSRSSKGRTGKGSSARSTDGDQAAGTSAADDK